MKDVFSKKSKGGAAGGGAKKDKAKSKETKEVPCIAIHCVAGLGRAPLMVAIALVQAGVAYTKAVEVIRAKRFVFVFVLFFVVRGSETVIDSSTTSLC